ncbi:putative transcriptional regulatory protein -like protein [Emericellopsis cladophorae]|uniref:Transcriptional regulatory protein -like protein n=1 Tax=Emericellopsis cladophorae TaxID=2686198 RepID=A0A9P9XY49_9HYPO|nr:putative transcriptional regulatory protein -like protein [Emericellopsis cladophorae]KAI6779738.1 putative transcriptional regulatory protein -like protein [Emericellopsis cladophorae]
MYGQPPHSRHLHAGQQHQQPFDPNGALPIDPQSQAAMGTPDFTAFPFAFQQPGLHDPNAMIVVQGQPATVSPAAYAPDGMRHPQQQHMATTPTAPIEPSAVVDGISRSSMDGGRVVTKKAGITTPTAVEAKQERTTPNADPLDDKASDHFEPSNINRADGTDLGGRAKGSTKTGDAQPAWTELKTKAGKERKRLPLACIACRRKKIRCSGEKPACKHCLRSRVPCVYKVTTRKAAPRTDYMAMLDKRLKRMEERIIKVVPKSDQDSTTISSVTRAVVRPGIPGTENTNGKTSAKKRGAEEAFGPSLEAWATRHSSGEEGAAALPCAFEDDENHLFQEGSDALPSKELQEHLAEVYFDNVYGQSYPLLHKPSYMRKLKSNSLPPVLILAVCAVAARFSSSPKLNSPTRQFLRGEEWAAPARDICTRRYESPDITLLTCLLILGLHEMGTCQGGRSWALGGQAIRMAFALQLHKDLEYDPTARKNSVKLSFVDREIRRRIMWSCFIMDRFNSSGSERPMFIKEDDILIPLPVKERHFLLDMPAVTETLNGHVLSTTPSREDAGGDASENLGVAAFMIRAIALWGRIVVHMNQGGKKLDPQPLWSPASQFARLSREADEFPHSLPESLRYSTHNVALHQNHQTTNMFLFLHVICQQNILFLSRSAIQPAPNRPEHFVVASRSKALAAATQISEILKTSEEARVAVMAPFATYCAFSSTTVHIRGIASGNPAVKATAEANATTNIRFMRKMMKHWGMFHWMEEDIRMQYRVVLDKAKQGATMDELTESAPMLQYGDWFNRYPHGVSDADYVDPAAKRKKEKGADGVLEQKPELQSVEEFFTQLSSPKTAEKPSENQPSKGAKRKASKKSMAAIKTAPPPSLHGEAPLSSQSAPPAPDQRTTPHAQHHPPPLPSQQHQRQQQRRPSASVVGKGNSPHMFQPMVTTHPAQSASFHAMSPANSSNVEQHFYQAQPGQQPFFQPDMMGINMQQQQQQQQQHTGVVQPNMEQHLSFGNYTLDHGTPPRSQIMDGWNGAQGHAQPGGAMPMAHGHQGQPQGSLNGEPWYMSFDMQQGDGVPNPVPGHPEQYNAIFAVNSMAAQNPLGGLRHAP